MHWGCDYATTLNIEVDPQRPGRRFGRRGRESNLLLEARPVEEIRLSGKFLHEPRNGQTALMAGMGSGLDIHLQVRHGCPSRAPPSSVPVLPRRCAAGGRVQAGVPLASLRVRSLWACGESGACPAAHLALRRCAVRNALRLRSDAPTVVAGYL